MRFTPPSLDESLRAIGPIDKLPETLRRALQHGSFAPVPVPGASDWLANHPEEGQTFEQFARSRFNKPDANRHTIYLQPLGEFPPGDSPPLDKLQRFAAAFFSLQVEVLPVLARLDLTESRITSRRNPYTGQTQLLTSDILALLRRQLPGDAYALLGITMVDLYPDPAWNFVFGQASLRHRVGVYSFARYDPRHSGERPPDDWQQLMLRRSCKVLAHETAHMFGIAHCIFFHCLMNGSNHLHESDARPMHLCPLDLRKLHSSIGFDVVERYSRLREFCESAGFRDEAQWLAGQLSFITG